MQGREGYEEFSDGEEDDRLAGLYGNAAGYAIDEVELSEEAKKELQHTAMLRRSSVSHPDLCWHKAI